MMFSRLPLHASLIVAVAVILPFGVAGTSSAQDGTFQTLEIPLADGAPNGDEYGVDVDLAGDLVVAGAPLWFDGVNDHAYYPEGADFLFRRNNAGTPSNPNDDIYDLVATLRDGGSQQGRTIATDGTSVFVGGSPSRMYEDTGGGVWAPAADLAVASTVGNSSAAMHNGVLVLGRSASIEVWERSGSTWAQSQLIPRSSSSYVLDFDGTRIAVAGETAGVDVITTYVQSGGAWSEEQAISVGDFQGWFQPLRVDGDTIVLTRTGGVLIFERDPSLGWLQKQALPASNSVEVDGDRIYLGTASAAGKGVDIYQRGETQWELREAIPSLLPSENVVAIAAANGTVVVGQERLSDPDLGGGTTVFRVPFYATTTDTADVPLTLTDGATGEGPVEITFSNISSSGTTSLSTTEEAPSLPTGFSLGEPATYYDIQTTATFSGTIQICIDYTGVQYADEADLRLLHYENGAWQDVTTTHDTANDIICGEATSLSPFAIVDPVAPPNPVVMILDLVADITALNLANGIENSLDAKLDSALSALEDAAAQNDQSAINAMQAFISAVNAQSGSHIPEADAHDLVQSAEEIIAVLYLV
jgi:hypothetical protein